MILIELKEDVFMPFLAVSHYNGGPIHDNFGTR